MRRPRWRQGEIESRLMVSIRTMELETAK